MDALTVTVETGPGGTELIVRNAPSTGQHLPRLKTAPSPETERTPAYLHQAVENVRLQAAPEKVEAALHQRRRFWLDTCREALEMQAATRQVIELHRKHGCRFRVPAVQQIQDILNALDAALPAWDRDHPELFYSTLELNFPEVLRLCPVPRRG